MRSESDQSGYPMNHPSNRRISIRSDYPSDWSDGSSDIRMDPSSDWADSSLLSDGWVSHFFCLKRKRADIRSIRSDPINPMAHHRLKKKTGLRSIRSIRSIRSGPIDPMAHHRLSAAIRGLNFLSQMESSRDHPADGLIGFIRIAPLPEIFFLESQFYKFSKIFVWNKIFFFGILCNVLCIIQLKNLFIQGSLNVTVTWLQCFK